MKLCYLILTYCQMFPSRFYQINSTKLQVKNNENLIYFNINLHDHISDTYSYYDIKNFIELTNNNYIQNKNT